ncbi:hypothetical protein B0H12DRAFT_379395 [Mycena haematopus]|nr:hypothetical protein B0H12DRAFT_379395 [Mycena haematopus]
MSEPPVVQDASDPFAPSSNPENPPDVILRSSDLVDFHAHKAFLSYASAMFRDMFSFPAPVTEEPNMMKVGKPIVPLTESSKTVEKLLVLCYPLFSGHGFRDLDGVDGAYEAAHKYIISGGQKKLEQVLEEPRFLEKEPHRVFAIACHRGMENLAKAAAMETLKMPRYVPHMSVPEFELISARRLRQLEDFHFNCSEIMVMLLRELSAVDSYDYPEGNTEVWWSTEGHSEDCGAVIDEASDCVLPANWFRDHISAVQSVVSLCPDVKSASKVAEILGPTVGAISKCPKCVSLAPMALSRLARDVERNAIPAYKKILVRYSFVD